MKEIRRRTPTAQIVEDLPFHHRQWLVQRIGWALTAIILVLGLLGLFGLFGDGPLSHVRAGSPALHVEYQRFIRRDNPAELRIDVQPGGREEIRLTLDNDYLHAFQIESILPRPQQVETSGAEVILVFRVAPQTASARITLNAIPLHAGALQGTLRVIGNAEEMAVPIDQFTFP